MQCTLAKSTCSPHLPRRPCDSVSQSPAPISINPATPSAATSNEDPSEQSPCRQQQRSLTGQFPPVKWAPPSRMRGFTSRVPVPAASSSATRCLGGRGYEVLIQCLKAQLRAICEPQGTCWGREGVCSRARGSTHGIPESKCAVFIQSTSDRCRALCISRSILYHASLSGCQARSLGRS